MSQQVKQSKQRSCCVHTACNAYSVGAALRHFNSDVRIVYKFKEKPATDLLRCLGTTSLRNSFSPPGHRYSKSLELYWTNEQNSSLIWCFGDVDEDPYAKSPIGVDLSRDLMIEGHSI